MGPEFTKSGKYFRDEDHITSTKFTYIINFYINEKEGEKVSFLFSKSKDLQR